MQMGTDSSLPTTKFFGRTYDETLDLVRRTRDYLLHFAERDCAALDMVAILAYSAETSRITTRLTHLMAWLLLQRAIHEGELSVEEARREAPELARIKVCIDRACVATELLPMRLVRLLEESDRLYRRIMRLDEMIRRDTPPALVN